MRASSSAAANSPSAFSMMSLKSMFCMPLTMMANEALPRILRWRALALGLVAHLAHHLKHALARTVADAGVVVEHS